MPNIGKNPLIINHAKGSCGCTVPEWPREPIIAGGEGEIRVKFNSKGKQGEQGDIGIKGDRGFTGFQGPIGQNVFY